MGVAKSVPLIEATHVSRSREKPDSAALMSDHAPSVEPWEVGYVGWVLEGVELGCGGGFDGAGAAQGSSKSQ